MRKSVSSQEKGLDVTFPKAPKGGEILREAQFWRIVKPFYKAGISTKKISEELNRAGYKTGNERLWTQQVVSGWCYAQSLTDIKPGSWTTEFADRIIQIATSNVSSGIKRKQIIELAKML